MRNYNINISHHHKKKGPIKKYVICTERKYREPRYKNYNNNNNATHE